jgi:hypothetical protein
MARLTPPIVKFCCFPSQYKLGSKLHRRLVRISYPTAEWRDLAGKSDTRAWIASRVMLGAYDRCRDTSGCEALALEDVHALIEEHDGVSRGAY